MSDYQLIEGTGITDPIDVEFYTKDNKRFTIRSRQQGISHIENKIVEMGAEKDGYQADIDAVIAEATAYVASLNQ